MQLKLFAIMTLATSVLAAPSVEKIKRTNTPAACAQGQGTQACCEHDPDIVPTSSLGSNIAPGVGNILGIIPPILALLVPTLTVATQCIPILAIELQECNAVSICCLNSGGSDNTDTAALISLLNNDSLAVCPGITA
ncbi:hypothetical protein BUE80_DR005730 [Diplocarpon rosae]|nr:hypothetical protein BUE80_DR005730 [Diplocarpon rosae]